MTHLAGRLLDDVKVAMRSGDTNRRDVLRYLRADVHYVEIERGHPLSDDEIVAVIRRQIKQRRDAIDQFARGGRQDLVEAEERQIAVLRTYLPAEMPRSELVEVGRQVAAELGASGLGDMSRLMAVLRERVGARAEGRVVADVARQVLTADRETAGS